jgi:hypothetical protein
MLRNGAFQYLRHTICQSLFTKKLPPVFGWWEFEVYLRYLARPLPPRALSMVGVISPHERLTGGLHHRFLPKSCSNTRTISRRCQYRNSLAMQPGANPPNSQSLEEDPSPSEIREDPCKPLFPMARQTSNATRYKPFRQPLRTLRITAFSSVKSTPLSLSGSLSSPCP